MGPGTFAFLQTIDLISPSNCPTFLGSSNGKEFASYEGDQGLIPGSRRSPGEGNDNSLQYSCLGNPMDRGACWATVHGVAKELDTTWWLNRASLVARTVKDLPAMQETQF